MKNILLLLTIIISTFLSEANAQKQIVYEGVTIPRTIQFENKTSKKQFIRFLISNFNSLIKIKK